GMMDRHYAPRARLVVAEPVDVAAVVDFERGLGRTVAALVIDATVEGATRLPADAAAYAARLYDALHALDDAGNDVIVVERVPAGVQWAGVRDRLDRAKD